MKQKMIGVRLEGAPAMQRVLALSDPGDVLDLYRQTQIKFAIEETHA